MDYLLNLFSTDFMPHGHCYFWKPEILWPHVLGDGFTALAYFVIPFYIRQFSRQRQDLAPYKGVLLAFSLFIFFCGLTHVLAVVSVWHPVYRLEAVAKVLTALISVGTIYLLIPIVPTLIKLPSLSALRLKTEEAQREAEQRRKMEEELRLSDENLQLTMELSPIGMALLDTQGKWLSVNPALCGLLGYTREELTQLNFQQLTPEEYLADDMEIMDRLLSGRERVTFFEKEYFRKDGSRVWVLVGVAIVRDEAEQPLHFISQVVDIDQTKRELEASSSTQIKLEQIIRQRTASLEETNRNLESFNYSIAHDLRAPIRTTTGMLDLLREYVDGEKDPELVPIIDHLTANNSRMDRMTHAYLKMGMLDRYEINTTELALRQLFFDEMDRVKKEHPGKNIVFTVEELPVAYGDADLIAQVVQNLISNAVKYAAHRPEIRIDVRGRTKETEVVVSVRDNGVGFAPEDGEQLFRLFKRLHSPTTYQGFGIGLSLVRSIIRKHGGRTWAEGEMNEGATFYFTLPVLPREEAKGKVKSG